MEGGREGDKWKRGGGREREGRKEDEKDREGEREGGGRERRGEGRASHVTTNKLDYLSMWSHCVFLTFKYSYICFSCLNLL